jgi:hypothetical protein
MKEFSIEIWNDECLKTMFYTVRFIDETENETDKFLSKYYHQPLYKASVEDLLNYILTAIGNRHGAVDAFFNRNEHQVFGLPNSGKMRLETLTYHFPGFPLRLYALKITEELVVLLSGGLKNARTNQESSLSSNWLLSCDFARKIIRNISDGVITVDVNTRKLNHFQSGGEIII